MGHGQLHVILILLLLAICHGQMGLMKFSIEEEQTPGQEVGNIKQTGAWHLKYNSTILNMLTFSFDKDNPEADYFELGRTSGVIVSRQTLDRESFPRCVKQTSCSIELDISVQPFTYFEILKISIDILDINDNVPAFDSDVISLALPESSPVDSRLNIPAASDPDSPQYGLLGYDLSTPSATFSIIVPVFGVGSEDIYLDLRAELDYESLSSYELHLSAYDLNSSTTVTLNITVTDVNDNSPEFTQTPYQVNVSEDLSPESRLVQVHTYDPDTGPSGMVQYSLSQRTLDLYGDTFSVNSTIGWILLEAPLDFESVREYALTVVATDRDPTSPLSTQTTVRITVHDTNDNEPQMRVSYLADRVTDRHLIITEHLATLQPLLFLLTEDADTGINALVSCEVDGGYVNITERGVDSYIIQTNQQVDRELVQNFTFNVTCRDHGEPALMASDTYTVTVADINDNAPVFQNTPLIFGLLDNLSPGDHITNVQAIDPDLGPNGTVSYYIESTFFRIDTSSGDVYLQRDFDVDALSDQVEFIAEIEASDNGSPPRTTSANITFVIINRNAKPPVILQESLKYSIQENSPVGTLIAEIPLTGVYERYSRLIRFQLGEDSSAFSISERNGTIYNNVVLDREYREVYTILLHVKYVGQSVYSSATVRIIVTDLNDNTPVIQYPSAVNNTLTISSKTQKNSIIAQILATDRDSGVNSQLSYSLSPHRSQRLLSVNESTGLVYVLQDLSNMEYEQRAFDVRVSDRGVPSLSESIVLHLVIDSSLPSPSESTNRKRDIDDLPLVASLIGAGALLLIILVVVVVVVRRQCATDKKYKDMQRKIDQFSDNNNSLDTDILQHMSPSTRGSDDGDSFRNRAMASYENILRSNYAQAPYAASEADSDSQSTDVSNTDSGRGSINRGPTDGAHGGAHSLVHTYIPEDGLYVPDLEYRGQNRHTNSERVRPLGETHRPPVLRHHSYDNSRRPQDTNDTQLHAWSGSVPFPPPGYTNPPNYRGGSADFAARPYGGNDRYSRPVPGPSKPFRSHEDLRRASPGLYPNHTRSRSDSCNYPSTANGPLGVPPPIHKGPRVPPEGPYYRHSIDMPVGHSPEPLDPRKYQLSDSDSRLASSVSTDVPHDPVLYRGSRSHYSGAIAREHPSNNCMQQTRRNHNQGRNFQGDSVDSNGLIHTKRHATKPSIPSSIRNKSSLPSYGVPGGGDASRGVTLLSLTNIRDGENGRVPSGEKITIEEVQV